MRGTWVALVAALGLGAATMLLFPYRAITPGTLAPSHLAQRKDCFSCHTLLGGAPAAKCSPCRGTAAWKPATFDHDQSFRFDRNHPSR